MPDYTTKNTLSGTSAAADLMENFFEPDATTPDTLEVINGWLDSDNLGSVIDRRALQPRTFTDGGGVGGSTALDYFSDQFGNTTFNGAETAGADTTNVMLPIPGACIRFYLPRAANVLFFWNITWACDLYEQVVTISSGLAVPVHFRLDGAWSANGAQRRCVGVSVYEQANSDNDRYIHWSNLDNRWAGHRWESALAAGWHDAGLYIGVSAAASGGPGGNTITQQARVRNRSMRYIAFR